MDEYSDKLKGLLAATHEYYRLVVDLQSQYEIVLKSKAVANPLSKSNESFSGEPIELIKYSLAIPTTLKTKLRKPLKRNVLGKKNDTKIALKAGLKMVQKMLDLRPPVTQDSIIKLMNIMEIPVEKYAAYRTDVLLRNYFGGKLKEFEEQTFKKYYFNNPPPFNAETTNNITWRSELDNLMTPTVDWDGFPNKTLSESLKTIIQYCSKVIHTAYSNKLDIPVTGMSSDEAFVKKVKKYNNFASYVNNISTNLCYNSSSLIFTYFHKAKFQYDYIDSILGNIKHSSTDIEKVCLRYLLVDPAVVEENVDISVKDPYNVVVFTGFSYETIKPALKSEFVLLKLLYYIREEFRCELGDQYRHKFMQIENTSFAINNVLQLFPGLMTLMFYLINQSKDKEGQVLLEALNENFLRLTDVKAHHGKRECIEIHKQISSLVERVGTRCIDLLMTDGQMKNYLWKYANLLFLKSGFIGQELID